MKKHISILRATTSVRLIYIAMAVYLLAGLSSEIAASGQAQQQAPPIAYRLEVGSENNGTFYVGEASKIKVRIYDQYGSVFNNDDMLKAIDGLKVKITITTLSDLGSSKQALQIVPDTQQTVPVKRLEGQRMLLWEGRDVIELNGFMIDEDESIQFTSKRRGILRVFAESDGLMTGETVLVVIDRPLKAKASKISYDTKEQSLSASPNSYISENPALMPVAWRPDRHSEYKLEIRRPTVKPFEEARKYESEFQVILKSASNTPIPAPRRLLISLSSDPEGNEVEIVPPTQNIEEDQAISPKFTLRSAYGGKVILTAKSLDENLSVESDIIEYEFSQVKPQSSHLVLKPITDFALATGSHEITLDVFACQKSGDSERVLRPVEEGLGSGRQITFHILGKDSSSVRFDADMLKNGALIKADESSTRVKIYSTSPVSNLTIRAESLNSLGNMIWGETMVSFIFPTWQLICAIFGGLIASLFWALNPSIQAINQKTKLRDVLSQTFPTLIQGVIGGILVYGAAAFYAIGDGPVEIWGVKFILTKFRPEQAFAALLLGILGGVIVIGAVRSVSLVKTLKVSRT